MTSVFENRLWEALQQHAEHPRDDQVPVQFPPAPRRRMVYGRRAGVVLAAAAATAVSFSFVPGTSPMPAYAVEAQPGGHIDVTVNHLDMEPSDLLRLEAKLRAAGIHVVVEATSPYTCWLRSDKGPSRHGSPLVENPGSWKPRIPKGTPKDALGGELGSTGLEERNAPGGRKTMALRRGDTAFLNTVRPKNYHRLVSISFIGGSCTPQGSS